MLIFIYYHYSVVHFCAFGFEPARSLRPLRFSTCRICVDMLNSKSPRDYAGPAKNSTTLSMRSLAAAKPRMATTSRVALCPRFGHTVRQIPTFMRASVAARLAHSMPSSASVRKFGESERLQRLKSERMHAPSHACRPWHLHAMGANGARKPCFQCMSYLSRTTTISMAVMTMASTTRHTFYACAPNSSIAMTPPPCQLYM